MRGTRLDARTLLAAVLATVGLTAYLATMYQQGGDPKAWFSGGLVLGISLAGYGTYLAAPHRHVALAVGGLVLAVLGVLGILSIGLPSLVAGVLCLSAAFSRSSRPVTAAPSGS